jgi:ubiquinone/menaquinone biosynthesis C-methylase UbiE
MDAESIEQRAIARYSEIAGSFEVGYHRQKTGQDIAFAYGRKRLETYLYPSLEAGGKDVLDVGCGTGHYINELRRRGLGVSGVDGSAEMLKHARANNPGADIRQARVQELPFPDESFDSVICIEVLRYLPNPVHCIREMARVLKPGGICLATAVPRLNLNGSWLLNRIDAILFIPSLNHLRQNFTSSRELRKQFTAAGFYNPDIRGVYFGPTSWIMRFAPKLLPGFLRWREPRDAKLANIPSRADFSNMCLVSARKRQ